MYSTSGTAGARPNAARTAAACAPVAGSSAEPGAFSMSTTSAPGSIARTVASSDGQITMTTRDRVIISRSMRSNTRLTIVERVNEKFVNC